VYSLLIAPCFFTKIVQKQAQSKESADHRQKKADCMA